MLSGSVAKLIPAPPSKYKTMPIACSCPLLAHTHAGYTRLNKDIFIILLRFMMLYLISKLLFVFVFVFVLLRLEVGGRTSH